MVHIPRKCTYGWPKMAVPGLWMRLVPFAMLALLVAPAALADHPVNNDPLTLFENFGETCNDGELEAIQFRFYHVCNDANGLVEVATDGYVLAITRTSPASFEVRVRHAVEPFDGALDDVRAPLAVPYVPLSAIDAACGSPADCAGRGFYIHGLVESSGDGNPLSGTYLEQRITENDGVWSVTFTAPPDHPVYVSIVGVVTLTDGTYVRGFYNPAKLALPLDPLDAVPYPTFV